MHTIFVALGVTAFFAGLMAYTTSISVISDNVALMLMLIGAIIASAGIIATALGIQVREK